MELAFPLVSAACILSLSAVGRADPVLQVVSHSYELRPQSQTVWFDMVFNRVPDFYHADSVGRQAGSFTLDLDADMNTGTGRYAYWFRPPLGLEREIDGTRIWSTGQLQILDATTWMPSGSNSFHQSGSEVQFEIPYAQLSIPSASSGIYYALSVLHYGGTTQVIMVVPLPRSASLGGIMFAGVVAWQVRRRAR